MSIDLSLFMGIMAFQQPAMHVLARASLAKDLAVLCALADIKTVKNTTGSFNQDTSRRLNLGERQGRGIAYP